MTSDPLWSLKVEVWALAIFVPLWWHFCKHMVAGCFRRID